LHDEVRKVRELLNLKAQIEADGEKYAEGWIEGLRAAQRLHGIDSAPRGGTLMTLVPSPDGL
jgi:hypothetical protein